MVRLRTLLSQARGLLKDAGVTGFMADDPGPLGKPPLPNRVAGGAAQCCERCAELGRTVYLARTVLHHRNRRLCMTAVVPPHSPCEYRTYVGLAKTIHTYIRCIRCIHGNVAGKLPYIRSYTVYIYG